MLQIMIADLETIVRYTEWERVKLLKNQLCVNEICTIAQRKKF